MIGTDMNQAPRETQTSEAAAEPAPSHTMHPPDENPEILQNWASDEEQKRLQELLHKISEESCQLNAYLTEEQKLVADLCGSIAEIMKRLHVSLSIPPQNLPLQEKATKVFLDEEAFLKLFLEKDEERSAFLGEYAPEIVMAVLQVAVPELHMIIKSYKKKVSMRIGFLEEIKKEVKAIAKAIAGSAGHDPNTGRSAEGSIQEDNSKARNEG